MLSLRSSYNLRHCFNLSKPTASILSVDNQSKSNSIVNSNLISSNSNLNLHQFNQVRRLSTADTVQWTINNLFFIEQTQRLLVGLHDTIGLPWYLEIMITPLVLRLTMLPLTIYERRQSAKFTKTLVPEMNKKLEEVRELVRRKLQLRELKSDKEATKFFNTKRNRFKKELYLKHNLHPQKRIIAIFYIPAYVWMNFSFSIGHLFARNQNLIEIQSAVQGRDLLITQQQAMVEGCLWFQNLTLPDAYHLLPLILSFSFLFTIEFNKLNRRFNYIEDTWRLKALTNFFRGFSIVLIYTASQTPSVSFKN